ncbi:MAG: rRNA pseudouridine synthase [Oscillospiraceae bacterium]|jgi:23S rRNA pseudouridine2605 synthase|nr:rRNA pseudouridine synthase [Oscillospiraceae bacterium]
MGGGDPLRLSKLLSQRGVASRRAAERLITEGRVTVNGARAPLGTLADAERDDVRVDGAPLPARGDLVYIMLNKPRGYITAMSDDRGRRTVAQLTGGVGARVYPVGRLDMESEGLLIMTNDGDFAHGLIHPSRGREKVYRVVVSGDTRGAERRLASPMEIDGRAVAAARVTPLSADARGGVFEIAIREGRNRQIRKMCQKCGLRVSSLRRVSIGGVELGDLPPGKWRHLTREELGRLGRIVPHSLMS